MTDHDADHLMDDRLRAAGARWRAANAAAAEAAEPTGEPGRPRRWGLLASAAVVVAVLGAAGVVALSDRGGRSDEGAASEALGLTGNVWRLLGDRGVTSYATLYIGRDGALVADDSCQVISAGVRPDGNELAATHVAVRHRGCTDSVGEVSFDPDFVDVLARTPRFELDGRTLRIEGRGRTYRFEADPALPRPTTDVPTFDGARWRLVRAQGPSGTVLDVPANVTLRVADGRLTATDGCNTLGGRVGSPSGPSVDGSALSVTEMACPGRMDTAAVLDKVFSGRFQQAVVGSRLTVTRAGAGTLVYEWVPDDTAATDPASLVGPTWTLTGIAGEPPAEPASLRFGSATSYEAEDGCGGFRGTAAIGSGSLRLTGVPDARPGCAQPVIGRAGTVDSFLGSDPLWTIRDDQLLIFGGGAQGFSLVYTRAAEQVGLTGRWTLIDAQPGAGAGRVSVLAFTSGTITIEGGCTRPRTGYSIQGRYLRLPEPLALRQCAPGPPQAILDVLADPGRVRFTLAGTTLTLTRGRTTLTLVRP